MNDSSDKPTTSDIPPRGEISPQAAREFDTAQMDLRGVLDPRDLRIDPAHLFIETTQQTRMAIAISDPHESDCPIVYVNQAFLDLTGYAREEVLGRNCRFLQGPATDRASVVKLRDGIAAGRYTVVDLLNYKKDGTPFWNAVHVGPIYDQQGALAYYYGSQWDITELMGERQNTAMQALVARELKHRTDNIFSVINAIVGLTARRENDVRAYAEKLSERLAALAAAHKVTLPEADGNEGAELGALVDAVMKPYRNRFPDRVTMEGPEVALESRMVTALGLALHELATNAIKYGALSVAAGRVSIRWQCQGRDLRLQWRELGGPSLEPSADVGKGTGTLLVDGMLASFGGKVTRSFAATGLGVTIALQLPA
ncbi:PAS domain-containing protein [Erythrobacter sp. SDW2]|uniref:PAS domain-containing protein n=1 Tax=Erythrobacter sp. SDW2 TaxID=2907154 RepID=UPI001F206440|nr:PAS domain-containing protein [Erythrobacter sp. SDW2]UIP06259.1 PAS domain-containing protein [Erythrobacter sp. SDW2]